MLESKNCLHIFKYGDGCNNWSNNKKSLEITNKCLQDFKKILIDLEINVNNIDWIKKAQIDSIKSIIIELEGELKK